MDRSELKGAEYNPRIISQEEKRRLRAILEKHGMVNPPVWNKRTGTLVSGHQRLSQLDALNGSPRYRIQVAVIDVDLVQEKELNIALNNPSAMGDWDLEQLEALMRTDGLDVAGTGFDMAEVFRLFGDAPGANDQNMDELAQKLRDFQQSYKQISDNAGRDDFYIVVVFRDNAGREDFLKGLGLDSNRYQDGRRLVELLGTRREVTAADVPS